MTKDSLRVRTDGLGSSLSSPRRLSPHIPNAHPRVTTPRAASPVEGISPQAAGHEAEVGHNEQSAALAPEDRNDNGNAGLAARMKANLSLLSACFTTAKTSSESARDFLARERTLFSWLRMSMLLSVASSALYLRLRLKQLNEFSQKMATRSTPSRRGQALEKGTTHRFESALRRKVARRRAVRSMKAPENPINAMSNTIPELQDNAHFSAVYLPPPYPTPPLALANNTDLSFIDTDVLLSEGLGSVFFVLALASLFVGYFDYMRAERALEHADKVVPFSKSNRTRRKSDAEEAAADVGSVSVPGASNGTSHTDHHPQFNLSVHKKRETRREGSQHAAARSAGAVRWHDARYARHAHSGRIVHITEIAIALVVFATALIILVSSGKASVAPVDPGEPT